MTLGMWVAAAVVGWCAFAVAVAFLVAAIIRLRDQQVPTENASLEELLMPVNPGVPPKHPDQPRPPKPPAVNR